MSDTSVTNLRLEYKVSPQGVDRPRPRFSWCIESNRRGARQSAYQIFVASSLDAASRGRADLWDSGKVMSSDTAHIAYDGKTLASRMQCWWRVRVWDETGGDSVLSETAQWTLGLLDPSDWQADWIGYDAPAPDEPGPKPRPITFDDCMWVTLPGDPPPHGETIYHTYRGVISIPDNGHITFARALVSSGDQFTLYVNGQLAGSSDGRFFAYRRGSIVDIAPYLHPGANTLAIQARHWRHHPGVIGKVIVESENGDVHVERIDTGWRVSSEPTGDWASPSFDDSSWTNVVEAAKANEGPWGPLKNGTTTILPAPMLRNTFVLAKPVRRATVYATALGVYELRMNGEKIGDDLLTPGWTDYHKRVYYQTYDATASLRQGENAIGAFLGHGWYSGYLGWAQDAGTYGTKPRLRVQLEIEYEDGSSDTIATDESWRASHGPIRSSDLYMGEVYDARKEAQGWDLPGFDAATWAPVLTDAADVKVQWNPGVQVARIMDLPAKTHSEPKPGIHVFDLEQNMVGWARIKVRGEAGETVRIRYAEVLEPDGSIYIENLRGAEATDWYTLKGGGEEVYEPRFTFHGFRYIELSGYPGVPALDAVTGVVIHSNMPAAGEFECSNAMLNQLQSNIVWGQRGNFLEVPTDCPQRDERLGWMGDAQVFSRTGSYNFDTAAFYTKWMVDVEDAQNAEGGFPDVAPLGCHAIAGAPAWADAGIIVPWTVYLVYGDKQILERHYDAMKAEIEYQKGGQEGLVRTGRLNNNYGDWLNIDAQTTKELVATAFFGYSTSLMADIAHLLGRMDDAAYFKDLFEQIRRAFIERFVRENGSIENDTQTAYVLPLQFNLLNADQVDSAVDRLVQNIHDRGDHLSTGFLGGAYLLHVLARHGYLDLAYKLLLNDTFPSWGYTIRHGATTIWERWDGWTHDKGFQDPGMNSFNHYAYGSVGDWMYQNIAGIQLESGDAGYQRIMICPRLGGGITHARGRYDSIHGPIESAWRIEGDTLTLDVTIPPNATATLVPPTSDAPSITESGKPAPESKGVLRLPDNTLKLDSGKYSFTMRI